MLILTRRAMEAVMIGPHISVRVLGIQGNQVRLGFTAPKDVAINREEVAERIHAEQCEQIAWSARAAEPEPESAPTEGNPPIRRRRQPVDGNR